ncbi:chemotaxis protein [Caproiciproducens galactitolivorans]|uniref:Methyl-accepting chemotaxis protein 1 n=1 Tax=Caproiciproducens galactitolivorans TaxID=642589 RepID=A0A4Z0YBM6_9FIRM|nr:PocR ligand-binding domain-containing protein [Caproiciproducens galactitolivorans]QEY33664.1 chemotaxis protein [Caproiciproducens galactitolivorans]TGJ76213.1 methyl-accepting chemotaxis protein 1 [Caproiciproducens galactitolivorans]
MIKTNEDGTLDMKVLEISDIIDISLLQKFQDNFAIGMNCASVTVDRNGTPVTNPSSYTRFCDGFVHQSQIGDRRCAESHHRMGEMAARSGRPFVGQCHAGLIDFAAPIIINGELIGTVLGGQVLSENPREEHYRKVANEIDVSGDGLVEAVKKIKVTDMKSISAAAEVLFIVVNALAKNGYAKIELEHLAKLLANKFIEISSTLEELASSAQNITERQQDLNEEISQVETITEEINDVLKSITQIASYTKILGINASIESARVGEAGRGFDVVAKEIQTLSQTSNDTAEHIMKLTKKIKESIQETVNNSNITLHTTQEQSSAMEEVSAVIQESVHIADQLNSLMKQN